MAGPAVRACEMARQLASHHKTTLAALGTQGTLPADFDVIDYAESPTRLKQSASQADVVIFQGMASKLFPWVEDLKIPIVVDLYDPFQFENLQLYADLPLSLQRVRNDRALDAIKHQLLIGDFFICASERQRHFWLGMLCALGRIGPEGNSQDPSFRALIDVVPFGLPDQPPEHTRQVLKGVYPGVDRDDQVVIWGGGLWDWLDPLSLIRAIAQLGTKWPNLKLFFMGTQRPGAVPPGTMLPAAKELVQQLGLSDAVIFNDWVPYDDRANFLLEADVGVVLSASHLESAFAFRTRVLDYIWAGLPILCTSGEVTAEIVSAYGLGEAATAGDLNATTQGLDTLLSTQNGRAAREDQFEAARQCFRWERAVEPLLRFVENPHRAPDATGSRRAVGASKRGSFWRSMLRAGQLGTASYRAGGMRGAWTALQRQLGYLRFR